MTILTDTLDLYSATLDPVTSPDLSLAVDYGADLSCDLDVTPDFLELTGDNTLVVAQSVARRLQTPRGTLPDDPDYGFDLWGQLNRGMDQGQLLALQGAIRSEVEKDDRVDQVTVTAGYTTGTRELSVQIAGLTANARAPFSLVFGLTDAGVLLREINANAAG